MQERRLTGILPGVKKLMVKLLSGTSIEALIVGNRHEVKCRNSGGVVLDASDPILATGVGTALRLGLYESSERRCLMRFFKQGLSYIDLGAGVGFMSSILARRMESGTLISVEANPGLHRVLAKNVHKNAASGIKWRMISGALSDCSASIDFHIAEDSHLGSHISTPDQARSGSVVVPGLTLEEICEGLPEFGLVCDIEGGEVNLLNEKQHVLDKCQLLIIELHSVRVGSRHWTPQELARGIEDRGMLLVHRDGGVYVFARSYDGRTGADQGSDHSGRTTGRVQAQRIGS